MLDSARRAVHLLRLKPFDVATPEGRSQERYRRIALTAASGLAVRSVTMVVGLVTVPLVLAYLGKERYGLWTAITTVVTWATLFDFGLANGLVNLVSRAHGREDHEEASRAFTTAMLALTAAAALLAGLSALAVPLAPWTDWLGVRGVVDDATTRWSVAAALGAFVASLPLSAVPQLYAGYQKSYLTNAFALAGSVGGLALLWAAVRLHASMPVLVLALSSMGLIAAALGLGVVRRALPWIAIRAHHASWQAFRALTSRSVPIFLFQLGALAVNQTQVLILAQRTGLASVADYGIAMRLFGMVQALIQLATASFVPPFREAHERGDRAWARKAFRRLVIIRLLLATGGGLAMLAFGNRILRLWLRGNDVAFGWATWTVVALLLVASVWTTVFVDFLWVMDRLWPLVGLVLVNGAMTVTLTWMLAPAHGVLGAFAASAAFTLLVGSWAVPLLARPLLGAPAPAAGAQDSRQRNESP
jgi:O-antigen/teichoic acid export membrane protein